MAHFKSNQRGGLSVDRDSLHASPEFKRQIAALNKLSENPMTLPQNVADAVDYIDASGFKGAPTYESSWQTIRAHLMSQEAEIERLREAMEPKLRELHYDANGLRATLDGGACKAIAESFAEQFNSSGAVNYLDVAFTTADGTCFVVTVQKRANPTAHELRQLAESRLAAANALLRECVAGLGHVGYPESMAMFNGDHRRAENLHDEILEHLQGAGDEA